MSDTVQRPVRVRVAPSPTGDPHVGTAYIGLFNYAFAKSAGGKFLLRIEDTDRERSTRESEEAIIESLHWLGLTWDEGPEVGGPFGPYRQSERGDVYREYAEQLLSNGAAYRCFCTPERLAALRQEQRARKESIGYDGACRSLSPEEAAKKSASGMPHVIRLAVPREGETRISDMVRGEVAFANAGIDDQVLLKSDGFPTYHLANVVDDHLMEISHVIRAEEWISSTPKHLLLYQAFGWKPPVFIHMPLLRNADKSKISKRKNPVSLLWYREQGYLPEALLNFLGLMGWSAEEGKEVFSLDDMVREFSWSRISTGGPVFDLPKLDWLNGVYIRNMPPEELARRIVESVLRQRSVSWDMVLRTIPLVQERLKKLGDYLPMTSFIFDEEVSPPPEELIPKKSTAEAAARILEAAAAACRPLEPWTPSALEERSRSLAVELDVKDRDVFMCLRVAVTGSRVSPPLFESMELVGRERCVERLINAAKRLRTG
jgi:glutamyl-tRNA synthetase